ncbi:MAG: FKBP-type peptidyl-prolyl cis-trans isomerase [Rhodospirillales bacterium]
MLMTAKAGDQVRVHYIGKTDDDFVFDSTMGGRPVLMRLGDGWNMPGFEEAVLGMEVGEVKTVEIPPEKAFGPRDPNKRFLVKKAELPKGAKPELGERLRVEGPDGEVVDMIPVSDEGEAWLMDSNHPLVGLRLIYEIGLAEII